MNITETELQEQFIQPLVIHQTNRYILWPISIVTGIENSILLLT